MKPTIQKFSDAQIMNLLNGLSLYANQNNLSNKELAGKLNIPYKTLIGWKVFSKSQTPNIPSTKSIDMIMEFLTKVKPVNVDTINEALRRTGKIKYILLLLEDELRWFRDKTAEERKIFRKELNISDIGYISSLITMLTDEDKFQRWLALTNTKFQYFGREKG